MSAERLERIFNTLSSTYWCWKYIIPEECPQTLFDVLIQGCEHIDPSSWTERANFGGIFINGKPVFENAELSTPCRIEYYEPKYDIEKSQQQFPTFSKENILYNDDDILIVFKPAGLPSYQPRDQRRHFLRKEIEQMFDREIHMPSRLDTSVSGIVAVSITERMHNPLQQLFEKRKIDKNYLLQVNNKPSWDSIRAENQIGKDHLHPILRRVVTDGGKHSITEFQSRANQSYTTSHGVTLETTLLQAKPITGRTHQIRVHAAHLGYPIIGDNFYEGVAHEDLHLISYRLRFSHPFTDKLIDILVPERFKPDWANIPELQY